MDCNLPGSSVHGIFQARVLEWVVISFSRGSSWLRDWTLQCLLHCRQTLYCLSHQGSPVNNKRQGESPPNPHPGEQLSHFLKLKKIAVPSSLLLPTFPKLISGMMTAQKFGSLLSAQQPTPTVGKTHRDGAAQSSIMQKRGHCFLGDFGQLKMYPEKI